MHSLSQALTFDIWVWQNIYRLCTVLSFLNYFQDTFNVKWIRHPHFFRQVCLHRVFQEPVWINTDLSSKRQDSLCMSWCFIRTQNKARWTSRSAKHLFHTVCVHSYSKRRALSRRKGNPIYGQKLQLSLYENRKTETFGNMKTLNMQLWQYMIY